MKKTSIVKDNPEGHHGSGPYRSQSEAIVPSRKADLEQIVADSELTKLKELGAIQQQTAIRTTPSIQVGLLTLNATVFLVACITGGFYGTIAVPELLMAQAGITTAFYGTYSGIQKGAVLAQAKRSEKVRVDPRIPDLANRLISGRPGRLERYTCPNKIWNAAVIYAAQDLIHQKSYGSAKDLYHQLRTKDRLGVYDPISHVDQLLFIQSVIDLGAADALPEAKEVNSVDQALLTTNDQQRLIDKAKAVVMTLKICKENEDRFYDYIIPDSLIAIFNEYLDESPEAARRCLKRWHARRRKLYYYNYDVKFHRFEDQGAYEEIANSYGPEEAEDAYREVKDIGSREQMSSGVIELMISLYSRFDQDTTELDDLLKKKLKIEAQIANENAQWEAEKEPERDTVLNYYKCGLF